MGIGVNRTGKPRVFSSTVVDPVRELVSDDVTSVVVLVIEIVLIVVGTSAGVNGDEDGRRTSVPPQYVPNG